MVTEKRFQVKNDGHNVVINFVKNSISFENDEHPDVLLLGNLFAIIILMVIFIHFILVVQCDQCPFWPVNHRILMHIKCLVHPTDQPVFNYKIFHEVGYRQITEDMVPKLNRNRTYSTDSIGSLLSYL